jgi:hypothetical protein
MRLFAETWKGRSRAGTSRLLHSPEPVQRGRDLLLVGGSSRSRHGWNSYFQRRQRMSVRREELLVLMSLQLGVQGDEMLISERLGSTSRNRRGLSPLFAVRRRRGPHRVISILTGSCRSLAVPRLIEANHQPVNAVQNIRNLQSLLSCVPAPPKGYIHRSSGMPSSLA